MLENAISILRPSEKPIVHSDRGAHYHWPGWIERIETAGLTRSMSRKGYTPDNACLLYTSVLYLLPLLKLKLQSYKASLKAFLKNISAYKGLKVLLHHLEFP